MANKSILSPTASKIYDAWAREGIRERPREYLGASSIGHDCDYHLWLMFRGVTHETFDGRMYRLFDRGKREEDVFVNDLRRIGIDCKPFDEHGNQFEVSDFGGHFSGHLDGVAKGFDEAPKQWFVCEFKTHNDSSFKKLCKEGVKIAKPMHYAQMQVYMGKTELTKAFYMAVNKDTDDLWCEIVNFDKPTYTNLMSRAFNIIITSEPEKCSNRPDDFRCKCCPSHNVCWHKDETLVCSSVPITCKTCCHSTAIVDDGYHKAWSCNLNRAIKEGETDCDKHLFLPCFVNGEIMDGTLDSIVYKAKNGKEFIAGDGKSQFSSAELRRVTADQLDAILKIKDVFSGARVEGSLNLAYKHKTEPFVFDGTIDELKGWMKGIADVDWAHPIATEEVCDCKFFEYKGYFVQIAEYANRACVRRGEDNADIPF